ncbi:MULTISPECIES: hypothetical protein [unclassified Bradyrhizobium]|uniref:hypothetical protein n=1 Tax=unclassified Bradyrhizobium TaxID=2631580 RepID=UPI0028E4F630|nr:MULTISPECIES: hypothetical protein [unclassified Bradyrhizobium]
MIVTAKSQAAYDTAANLPFSLPLGHMQVDVDPEYVGSLKASDYDGLEPPSFKPGQLVCVVVGSGKSTVGKERLACVAIKRDGEVKGGLRSHYELRQSIDPNDPDPRVGKPDDIDGFLTSTGRFVTRKEARIIGIESGQLHHSWKDAKRDVLSSDINW